MANRQAWLDSDYVDEETKQAIREMTDEKEVAEAFSRDLAFGTGGMRGVMGPGNDRMNPYTVRRAVLGVAHWLQSMGREALTRGVAIAFDTRHNSAEFARHAALTMAAEGAKVYLFDHPAPTPVLSFAIRRLGCATGIVITASHNTSEFNGMKIYNDGGCQLPPQEALPLMAEIETVPLFSPPPETDYNALVRYGRIAMVRDEMLAAYTEMVLSHALLDDSGAKGALSIVYTPLNGTGNRYIQAALAGGGFTQVAVVPEQEQPDGDFPTVAQPNPEDTAALSMAIALATQTGAALVVGSDPDSDRLGTAIFHEGAFHNITGNQIGVLLSDYILARRKALGTLPAHGFYINTIVSSSLGEVIAGAYGLEVVKTLTGFKYIGEQMIRAERENRENPPDGARTFVFGYEESNGYLIGEYARDKDAVGATFLFCEAAAYWQSRGVTLIDRLEEIYRTYGYYLDHLDNFVFPGIEGMATMAGLMEKLRQSGRETLPGVETVEDYLEGIRGIPKDNVLRFLLTGGSWIAARPSGTEPKLKIYFSIRGENRGEAAEVLEKLRAAVRAVIESA